MKGEWNKGEREEREDGSGEGGLKENGRRVKITDNVINFSLEGFEVFGLRLHETGLYIFFSAISQNYSDSLPLLFS